MPRFPFLRNGLAPKQRRASVRAADYGFIAGHFLNIAVAEQEIRGTWRRGEGKYMFIKSLLGAGPSPAAAYIDRYW